MNLTTDKDYFLWISLSSWNRFEVCRVLGWPLKYKVRASSEHIITFYWKLLKVIATELFYTVAQASPSLHGESCQINKSKFNKRWTGWQLVNSVELTVTVRDSAFGKIKSFSSDFDMCVMKE